jgi:hypothetical protein
MIMAILFLCIVLLYLVTFMGFEFIAESCFQNDYGITPKQRQQSRIDEVLEIHRCFVLMQFYKLQRYITKGDLCQMSFISNSVQARIEEMYTKLNYNNDPGVCLAGSLDGPRGM